eukprot:5727347-Amphidinium_carterae.1
MRVVGSGIGSSRDACCSCTKRMRDARGDAGLFIEVSVAAAPVEKEEDMRSHAPTFHYTSTAGKKCSAASGRTQEQRQDAQLNLRQQVRDANHGCKKAIQ